MSRLHGKLGVPAITLMVVAAASPLTVIAGGAPLSVAFGNGVGTPANYLLSTVFMLFFAIGLSTMSKYVKNAGAFYAYVGRGLGPTWGMAAAAVSWVTYTFIQVGVFAYFGLQLQTSIAGLSGFDAPWWLYSLLMIAAVGVLGYRNIELSARVLGIFLVLEVLVVVVIDIAVIAVGGDHGLNLEGFKPSVFAGDISLFALGIMFCANGFIGFEATAVFRDEAKDPDKTIPRATFLAVMIIGVFYTFSTWALIQGWGDDMKDVAATGSPFTLGLASRYVGAIWSDLTNVLLLTSLFACVLSLHNIVARYQFTLANSRVLPQRLSKVHPVHGSPSFSSLVQVVTAAALLGLTAICGLDPNAQVFAWASGISTLGFFVALCLTCLSVVVYFAKRPDLHLSKWKTTIAPLLGLAGLLSFVVLTVMNFPTLTGGGAALAYSMMAVVPLAMVIGATVSLTLKHTKSDRYAGVLALTEEA